jgi:cold shock CspA family protein
MRFEGTLAQWNEDRGFGFIEAAQTRERLFVHISAFERGRVRPPLGARLVFDVERDAQGRKRAVNVTMPGDLHAKPAAGEEGFRPGRRPARARRTRSPAWAIVAIVCVGLAVGVRYGRHPQASQPINAFAPPTSHEPSGDASQPAYRCDGRTRCSQMTSCAEATWMSTHCSGTQMDGNHDGVPCEQQWCGSGR